MSAAPPAATPASAADTGTVNRTLRILSALASRERWALHDLSHHLQLPRASTHRLLGLCRPLGFVEQDEDGLYRAGVELHRIAGKLAAEAPINRLADPLLCAIRDETQESVSLTLLDRGSLQMFFSHVALSPNPLRYAVECNRLQPLPWGAAGQSILAFMPQEQVEAVLARRDPSPRGQPPLAAPALRRELAAIREAGYATSYGQRAEDMHGIAVPFFDRSGQVRGNFLLSIPHFRHQPARERALVQLLRSAATELPRRLGWSDAPGAVPRARAS